MSVSLNVSYLKVHLAHCGFNPQTGRQIGLVFSANGVPAVVATPAKR